MKQSRNLAYITLADFTVRAAYQMGKTPLLSIFAAALGATDVFLGFIVSVSTLTGMILKPLVGVFSDRWGRRRWLIVGTAFFALVPFLYWLVHTPEELFAIRIVHGLATAIYGPVTLAYVAEQSQGRRAERLGWFGMARSGGYVVGPAVAGWLLLTMDPVRVFTVIGLISSAAFMPVLLLSESRHPGGVDRPPFRQQALEALKTGSRLPSIWLSGSLEAVVYTALYAARAFLPIHALSMGTSVAVVGGFFALQEGIHLVLRPLGGRAGDRLGYLAAVGLGMGAIGVALPLLAWAHGAVGLLALAVVIGSAQALIFPSAVALVSTQISGQHIGTGMGLIGTLENMGKVAGPIAGGLLIQWLDFSRTFWLMGLMLFGALTVFYVCFGRNARRQRPALPQRAS